MGTLSPQGVQKYMELFKDIVGEEQFERLMGHKDPKTLVEMAKKQEEMLMKSGAIPKDQAYISSHK